MPYELNSENILICKPVKTSLLKSVIDTDIIVPDTKPDVFHILQVNALSSINEKYVQKDIITVSGFVNLTILYCGSDNFSDIKNINYKAPFTQQIEAKGIDELSGNYVISDVSHIEYEICNSRKINIKTVVSFETGIAGCANIDSVSTVVSTINIPYKQEEINMLNMKVCSENKFNISDEFKISDSHEGNIEILRVDCKIIPEEHKTMNNKIIAKGIMNCNVLYSRNGDIFHIENQTPFTEVMDVENISPDMHIETKYSIYSCNCECFIDEEYEFLNVETLINFVVCGYEENKYNVMTDIYCPDYKTDVDFQQIDYFSVSESLEKSISINGIVELDHDEPPFMKIYNINTKPVTETISSYDGYCVLDGHISTDILYLSDDEERFVYSVCKKIPFSHRIENSSFNLNSKINADVGFEHSGYIIKNDKSLELRNTLKLSMIVMEECTKSIVSSVSIDENLPNTREDVPGITLYFPDDNEKLWDVAKKYSTTIEEIASVNNIESDAVLYKNHRLVIPKRVNIL